MFRRTNSCNTSQTQEITPEPSLFNWPSHCGQPIKRCLIGGSGCVAHKIFDSSIFIPAYIEPNLFSRYGIVSVFCRTDAGYTSNAFYVSINWPFCPFRQCSLCPFDTGIIRYWSHTDRVGWWFWMFKRSPAFSGLVIRYDHFRHMAKYQFILPYWCKIWNRFGKIFQKFVITAKSCITSNPFNLNQAIRYHPVNQFWSNCIFRLKLCVFRYPAVFPFVSVFFWKPVLW